MKSLGQIPYRGQPDAIPYTVIGRDRHARTFARFGSLPTPKGSDSAVYRMPTPYFLARLRLHRSRGGIAGLGQADLVSQMAAAIQTKEGWYPGSLSYRNNNPGNLRSGPGQTGTSGGFAVFPDYATGLAALDNQIQTNIDRGLTTNQFFGGLPGVYSGYAPASDSNDPNGYAAFVSSALGIDPNIPLNQTEGNSGGSLDASMLPDFSAVTDALSEIDPMWLAVGAGALGLLVYAVS